MVSLRVQESGALFFYGGGDLGDGVWDDVERVLWDMLLRCDVPPRGTNLAQ